MESWHEEDMLDKLYRLLDSTEPSNIELAFQIMFGMGVPFQEKGIAHRVANTNYKVGFCLRYGFLEYVEHVEKLYLYDFDFQELSPMVGQMRNLQEIEMRRNNMEVLPTQIGYLRRLQRLDLEQNNLPTLPKEIGYLSQLQQLNLSQNQLNTLPANIGDLARLSHLRLPNNQLTCLPEEMGDLHALDFLDLSHNRLTEIPERILDLPRLAYLLLTGNPLHKDQTDFIRKRVSKRTKVIF